MSLSSIGLARDHIAGWQGVVIEIPPIQSCRAEWPRPQQTHKLKLERTMGLGGVVVDSAQSVFTL